METRFNEVPRDRGNGFRYIEHLHDLTNFRENYKNDRYIEVKLILINLQNPASPDLKITVVTFHYRAIHTKVLETQEQAKSVSAS